MKYRGEVVVLDEVLSVGFLHIPWTARTAYLWKLQTRTDVEKLERAFHSVRDRYPLVSSPAALSGMFQMNQATIAVDDSAICSILYLECYRISLGLGELEPAR